MYRLLFCCVILVKTWLDYSMNLNSKPEQKSVFLMVIFQK